MSQTLVTFKGQKSYFLFDKNKNIIEFYYEKSDEKLLDELKERGLLIKQIYEFLKQSEKASFVDLELTYFGQGFTIKSYPFLKDMKDLDVTIEVTDTEKAINFFKSINDTFYQLIEKGLRKIHYRNDDEYDFLLFLYHSKYVPEVVENGYYYYNINNIRFALHYSFIFKDELIDTVLRSGINFKSVKVDSYYTLRYKPKNLDKTEVRTLVVKPLKNLIRKALHS
ncbi:hypothetical protein [Saccharolobus islandicus]|uniref:Uncharacterized protein n=1 Tax=Saccharolobus islandicus (strain M.16.4 / Kamchatka \|nr:hypothetical protein [Sulfolobus islandicus]ACR41512.1 hypothetical protein M164_0900 [Sulfolobus islandicus M.16.4]